MRSWPLALVLLGCTSSESSALTSSSQSAEPSPAPAPSFAPPLPSSAPEPSSAAPRPVLVAKPRCSADMVLVKGRLCVDRFESYLVDERTGAVLSPYYPPEGPKAAYVHKMWEGLKGTGTELEKTMDLPPLPAFQRERAMRPKAISRKDRVPQAYASGKDAAIACNNAGKRLCTRDEWKLACRGEQDRDFPYGDKYERGKCNTVRDTHPGILLWENPSINHTDPRFNKIADKQGPLLRKTGATPTCTSDWDGDKIYDMVGNVDEWIDDPEGTFVGAFYARGKKDGCQSGVEAHVLSYADYSTGVRCCADATTAAAVSSEEQLLDGKERGAQ
jgi:hypothetical protein